MHAPRAKLRRPRRRGYNNSTLAKGCGTRPRPSEHFRCRAETSVRDCVSLRLILLNFEHYAASGSDTGLSLPIRAAVCCEKLAVLKLIGRCCSSATHSLRA